MSASDNITKQKTDGDSIDMVSGNGESKAAKFMDKFNAKMTAGMKDIEPSLFTINEDNWVYSAPSISENDIDQLDFYSDNGKVQVMKFLKDIKVLQSAIGLMIFLYSLLTCYLSIAYLLFFLHIRS